MKLLKTVLLIAISASFVYASSVTKKGVLVTKSCASEGRFIECPLTSYAEDPNLVLFVHEDLKYYELDMSKIAQKDVDEGFARNGVEISGTLKPKTNQIVANSYKAPPPPAASAFKG